MEVEGLGAAKDMKLWPGGGRGWDWRETGTHHVPGIQTADLLELLEHECAIVVLSRGQQLRLQTCSDTINYLEKCGVRFQIEETNAAVALYNRLAKEEQRVGGLFHSTC